MTDYYGRESFVITAQREKERGLERRRPISQLHSDVKMTDSAGAAGPLTGFIGP